MSASSVGYLGSDSLGSTLACSRGRESWGLFFAAFCQAARPNPFRHKEDIFRVTNVQSVTGQTKRCVSEIAAQEGRPEISGKEDSQLCRAVLNTC